MHIKVAVGKGRTGHGLALFFFFKISQNCQSYSHTDIIWLRVLQTRLKRSATCNNRVNHKFMTGIYHDKFFFLLKLLNVCQS